MTDSAIDPQRVWPRRPPAGRKGPGGANVAHRPRNTRRFSLEARLAAVTSLVLVLVSTVVFIELTARDRAKLMSAKTGAAAMLTQLLANELSAAIDFDDFDDVSVTLNYLRGNEDIVAVAVWSAQNPREPIGSWSRAGVPSLSAPTADEQDGATTSDDWLVATRTVLGRRRAQLGRVRVLFTLAPENEAFRSNRLQLFWMTAALTAIAAISLALLARRYVVTPIRRLATAATALAEGDLSARVDVRTDDEIADLARAFNVMGEAVRFREERLHKELELAKRIQTSILPPRFSVPGMEVAATMVPATQVGGDYYDVLPVEHGAWLGIGDVAGHGLDAGLCMLMMQSIVASLVARDSSAAPEDLVCVVNEVLFDNAHNRLGRDGHATLSLLHYEESGEVVYAGAHEDIIVCRADSGRCEAIATPGTWVGSKRDIRHATTRSKLELRVGDVMLLYSDGALDVRNERGEPFGFERLCSELEQIRDQPVAKIQEHLLFAIGGWGTSEDDVTLVVARYVGV
jgi:serine phosphatase RsbU (regulator of sigma subunit)